MDWFLYGNRLCHKRVNVFADVTGYNCVTASLFRGGSRAAATSKKERFVIIANGFEPLTVITKRSILNAAAALDPPLLLGKISLQSKKQLTEIFRTCKKNLTVNIIFNSSIGIRNVFRFKDIIPTFMNSKVVYKFKCNICNDVYLGETKRHLLVRQYEHLGKSILTVKPSKYNDKDATAIRKQCHQNNHQADCSCFTLIGSASNNFHLKLKELLLIFKFKQLLNVAKESMPLYLFDNDA